MQEHSDPAGSETSLQEQCALAAQVIGGADVLLLCTGAGFSADSGLAVYRDIAEIPVYASRGLKYHDICDPCWLDAEPSLFYGFWGTCFNDYRATNPHRGYEIVERWRRRWFCDSEVAGSIRRRLQEAPWSRRNHAEEPYRCHGHAGAFFVFTSNVDAHSFDHFDASEVRECHGNTELWQCSVPCCFRVWRAPRDLCFAVDLTTMEASPGASTVLPEGISLAEDAADVLPRVGRVKHTKRVQALRGWPQEESDASVRRAFEQINRPSCIVCSKPARPAILMFGDCAWVDNDAQEDRYNAWLCAVEEEAVARHSPQDGATGSLEPMKACILEIGCGKNVPTVRWNSQQIARRFSNKGIDCTLVRINPDFPGADGCNKLKLLALRGGGLECLEKIDAMMAEHQQQQQQQQQSAEPTAGTEKAVSS